MPNYQLSKIYKLVPINYETEYIPYYGSSTQKYLSSRLTGHIRDFKRYLEGKMNYITSFKLFEDYGIENIQIILVENYPCNDKYELESKERYYIENNLCINKNVPTRTTKEYREGHKEETKLNLKNYRENNKDKIK